MPTRTMLRMIAANTLRSPKHFALSAFGIVMGIAAFVFFLGLSTALDVVVAYFFMHPLVSLMSRRTALVRTRPFGIGSGLDAPEAVS